MKKCHINTAPDITHGYFVITESLTVKQCTVVCGLLSAVLRLSAGSETLTVHQNSKYEQ